MIEKSLLWEALRQLSKPESRSFLRFLHSPWSTVRSELFQLATSLFDHISQGIAPQAQEVWPRKDQYSDQKMRQLLSDTLEQLEIWMGLELYLANRPQVELDQAKAYLVHGLEKHFGKALREANLHLEQRPYRHAGYFEAQVELSWLQYQHDAAASRTGQFNLQTLADQTEQAFIVQRLRIACLQANHTKSFGLKYEAGMLSLLLEHIELSGLKLVPAIGLYYACYRFLTEAEPEQYFRQFTEQLRQYAKLFPDDELRTLYLLAINYAIVQVNAGRTELVQVTLNLYDDALERRLLFEHGLLSRFAFTNMVAVALRSSDTARARSFIQEYSSFLEKKHRTAIVNLNLARIAYTEKDYDAVLTLLQKSDYKDLINNLIAKTLQLKVYYETRAWSLLESHLASLRIFIKRQKQIGYRQEGFLKLIKYTQQLVQLEMAGLEVPAQFVQEIAQEPNVLEREWLLLMVA